MDENNKPTESSEAPKVNENYFKDIEKSMSEQNSKLEALTKSQNDLIQALSSRNESKAPSAPEDMSSLMYSDPDAFARKIEERAEKKAEARTRRQAEEQAELSRLVQEFPELSDPNHEITREAINIYGNLGESEKNSRLAYKTAVHEAALKHGLLPKSKRTKVDTDNFSLGSSKGSSSRGTKVDSRMMEFARIIAGASGRDIDSDKGYADRLANIAKQYNKRSED